MSTRSPRNRILFWDAPGRVLISSPTTDAIHPKTPGTGGFAAPDPGTNDTQLPPPSPTTGRHQPGGRRVQHQTRKGRTRTPPRPVTPTSTWPCFRDRSRTRPKAPSSTGHSADPDLAHGNPNLRQRMRSSPEIGLRSGLPNATVRKTAPHLGGPCVPPVHIQFSQSVPPFTRCRRVPTSRPICGRFHAPAGKHAGDQTVTILWQTAACLPPGGSVHRLLTPDGGRRQALQSVRSPA